MNKQRVWTGLAASAGMLILILDGRTALMGAREGIELCLRTVIPSLFPFFLLTILLTGSFCGMHLGILRPIGKIFGLPDGMESLLIPAFLGGYPAGAQSIGNAYKHGVLQKDTAQRLLTFCSNAGPAFLFGITAAMFPEAWMPWMLWFIHLFSAYLVSSLFSSEVTFGSVSPTKPPNMTEAMLSALTVTGTVCGWVIVFRIAISFLRRWFLWLLPSAVQVPIIGLLELSNGCCSLLAINSVPLRFTICACMLAAGGLCVMMQTLSVTEDLSLKYYIHGKCLQVIFSLILALSVWHPWILIPSSIAYYCIIPEKNRKNSRNPVSHSV